VQICFIRCCALGAAWLVGCSTFPVQVPPQEPHTTLTIHRREVYGGSKDVRVMSIDGHKPPRPKKGEELTLLLQPGEHRIVFRNKARMLRTSTDRKTPAYLAIPLALATVAASGLMTPGPSYEMEPYRSASLKTVVLWTTNVVTMAAGSAYWTDGLKLVQGDRHAETNP